MKSMVQFEKTGFYIFDNADLSIIPDFAKPKFMKIYTWFKENHVPTVWSSESLNRAGEILYCAVNDDPITEEFFSKEEIQALQMVDKITEYKELEHEAVKEFCHNGGDWYPKGYMAKQRLRYSVFMDFLLRNPIKIQVINKLSVLREKVQERIGFEHGEWVGF